MELELILLPEHWPVCYVLTLSPFAQIAPWAVKGIPQALDSLATSVPTCRWGYRPRSHCGCCVLVSLRCLPLLHDFRGDGGRWSGHRGSCNALYSATVRILVGQILKQVSSATVVRRRRLQTIWMGMTKSTSTKRNLETWLRQKKALTYFPLRLSCTSTFGLYTDTLLSVSIRIKFMSVVASLVELDENGRADWQSERDM